MSHYARIAIALVIINLIYLTPGDAIAHHGGKVHISPFLKLYVRIIDNSSIDFDGSFGSELSELDRFRFMSESITETFEAEEYPVTLKFVRFGKDIPPDVNVLTISITRWSLNQVGEYETRIFAKLKARKGKINLGYFIGRYIAVNIPGRDIVIKNFKISARKALEKLLSELQTRTLPRKFN